jgi:hypothetical protein
MRADAVWSGIYRRVSLDATLFARLGQVEVFPRARIGWGEELPIHQAFPLGGVDGFPGLHLGERRGDREALLGLMLTAPVRGPLVARLEVAGGRTANGGALLADDRWIGGIRAGLGANTPVGPVRFEYGYNTEDRGAVFIRLGEWP